MESYDAELTFLVVRMPMCLTWPLVAHHKHQPREQKNIKMPIFWNFWGFENFSKKFQKFVFVKIRHRITSFRSHARLSKIEVLEVFWDHFENFQNGLKKLLVLRFYSNEHVIEMRWFCVGFWQKQIFEIFLKNFRIPKNFKKSAFLYFFALVADVYDVPQVATSGTWACGPPKKLIQHHSFPMICLKFSNSSWFFLKVFG